LIEVVILCKFHFFRCVLVINMIHVVDYCLCCVGQQASRTSSMTCIAEMKTREGVHVGDH
jgi:hypothetical protein